MSYDRAPALLRHHVSGAIERGEARPIAGIPHNPTHTVILAYTYPDRHTLSRAIRYALSPNARLPESWHSEGQPWSACVNSRGLASGVGPPARIRRP